MSDETRWAAGLALVALLLGMSGPSGAAPAGFIVDPTSNCGTSNPFPRPGESIRWQGGCRDGKLQGRGLLIWFENNKEYERNEGVFTDGELDGEAIVSFANGNRIYGTYRRGIRHGEFTVVRPDSKLIRATYQNGAFVTERLLRPEEAATFEAERHRLEQRLAAAPVSPTPAAPSAQAVLPPIAGTPPSASTTARLQAPPLPAPPAPPPPSSSAVPAQAPPLPAPPAPSPPPAPPPVQVQAPAAAATAQPSQPAAQLTARPGSAGRRTEPPIRLKPPAELGLPTAPDYGPETLVIDSRSARDFPRTQGQLRLTLAEPSPAPSATASRLPASPTSDNQRFAVRIVDWPVAEAAALLFGTVIQRPYRIDPAVTGRITVQPSGPVDASEATAALAEALRPLGARLVSTAEALVIMPTSRNQR